MCEVCQIWCHSWMEDIKVWSSATADSGAVLRFNIPAYVCAHFLSPLILLNKRRAFFLKWHSNSEWKWNSSVWWLELSGASLDSELMCPHSPPLLIKNLILFIIWNNNRNQTPGNVCQGCKWNGLMRGLHMWMMKYAWVIPSFLFQTWDH